MSDKDSVPPLGDGNMHVNITIVNDSGENLSLVAGSAEATSGNFSGSLPSTITNSETKTITINGTDGTATGAVGHFTYQIANSGQKPVQIKWNADVPYSGSDSFSCAFVDNGADTGNFTVSSTNVPYPDHSDTLDVTTTISTSK